MGAHHYPISRQIVRVELDDAWIDTAMCRLTGVAHAALHDSVFAPIPGDHCHNCAYTAVCEAAPAVAA